MHTLTYIPQLSMVAICGGRNDHMVGSQVFDDIWILKLFNMEYVKVQIGGKLLPVPRFSHCAVSHGSKLLILGGLSGKYQLAKEVLTLELDQAFVDKNSPYVMAL
jgi:hypothetical protein